jgi:hypothetical protein
MLSLLSSVLKTFNNQVNTKDIIKENELNKQLQENVFIPIREKQVMYGNGKQKSIRINQASFENKIRRILQNHFQKEFKKVRLNCLKNPLSGRNLEIDIYNEDLKLGLEFNGIQHSQYTPYFHKSYKDFENGIIRDLIKAKLCKENGIKLITINHWEINKDMLDSEILQLLLEKIAKVL